MRTVAEIQALPDKEADLTNIGEVQDAFCLICDALWGGELAWEEMGLKKFSMFVTQRLHAQEKFQ